jgi:ATP-dependent RNA helicase DeaD
MFPPHIHPKLAEALAKQGYSEPTSVQAAVLEEGTEGRDLLVSARTGSGKTVAFGLAIGADVVDDIGASRAPLALAVAPTRELALQVQRELTWLYAAAGARVVSCVGGMDIRKEQRALAQGADIVVGTPGRLCDHIERGHLQTDQLRAVVLDEADEMLDLGFREELERILDATPEERRTLLFSATIPKPIAALARQYQDDALRIVATEGETQHADIDYRAVRIAPSDIEHATVNLLRFHEAGAAIVFCSTREAVRKLHANLVERGFVVVALSGELSQSERTHALQALRDRRARVCVATDVAARGIDIPDLELVIHADLPRDPETLQHRSGRTGRAGKKGVSALLVPHNRRRIAERLLGVAKIEATWETPPSAEDIRAKDQERLLDEIATGAAETAEEDQALVSLLLERLSPEAIAGALIRQSRARLPAPEELDDNEPPPREERGPRQGFENTVWFRILLGRNRNAEARWLLPLICRRGHLTKQDIGAIRVFERETKFEIKAEVAERFMEAIKKSASDDEAAIEPADGAAPPPRTDRGPKKPWREKADRPPRGDWSPMDAEAAPRKPQKDRPKKDWGPREERGPRPERPRSDKPLWDAPAEVAAPAERAAKPDWKAKKDWKEKPAGGGKAKRVYDKPKFDGPKFDGPKADKPKFGKPKFDKPKFGGPKFDGPKKGKPKFKDKTR